MDDLASALELARRDPRRQLGRFLVLGELGRGGMGVVYRAWDPAAERQVALKVLLEDDPDASARFKREGDAVARLQHPGIVRVHEQGVLGARPFVVMELVEGRSLEQAKAPLPVAEAVALARALCDALTHAHERGVVHRDVKPSNVIVGSDGQPRILDFGLAKLIDRSRLTRSGALLGTASYMAPEQLDGSADARSDTYSLGATLYWMLTGRAPFTGQTVQNILLALARKAVEPPSRSNPAVTPELEAVLLRCLEKDPAARYPTAAAFSKALERALGGERVEPRRPGKLVAAVALGLALLLTAGLWRASSSSTPPPAPPIVDPVAAVKSLHDRADAALAQGDTAAATSLLSETAPLCSVSGETRRRQAALEGEAAWLEGDLERAKAAMLPAGLEAALLRRLLATATGDDPPVALQDLAAASPRPSVALARAIALSRMKRPDQGAAALREATRVNLGREIEALMAAGAREAALALVPLLDMNDLDATAAEARVSVALQLLQDEPERAGALVDAARRSERFAAADAARVLDRALAATRDAARAGGSGDALADYQRALRPYRVALTLDPSATPPEELVVLLATIEPKLSGPELDTKSAARNLRAGGLGGADLATVIGELRLLDSTAPTLRAKREVAFHACDVLVHHGRASEAVEWIARACANTTADEFAVHDFLVQWARTLWATNAPEHQRQAFTLLDQVIAADPLHGDARELRGRALLDTGGDLDQAAADLRLAVHDFGRERNTTMRENRNPFILLVALELARNDVVAARAAWDAYRANPKYMIEANDGAWVREVRARLEAAGGFAPR